MGTTFRHSMRLSTCGAVLMFAVLLTAGCGGASSGGCQLPGEMPSLAGTPIPPQPIPQGAGVTTNVTVAVNALVDSTGNVVLDSIKTSSQNAIIDEAALTLVRSSKFNPGVRGCGPATPNAATVTVPFSPGA